MTSCNQANLEPGGFVMGASSILWSVMQTITILQWFNQIKSFCCSVQIKSNQISHFWHHGKSNQIRTFPNQIKPKGRNWQNINTKVFDTLWHSEWKSSLPSLTKVTSSSDMNFVGWSFDSSRKSSSPMS